MILERARHATGLCLLLIAISSNAECVSSLAPISGLFLGTLQPDRIAAGRTKTRFCLSSASHATLGANAGTEYVLDGATHQLDIEYARALTDHWHVAARLPVIKHDQGFLDNLIDNWHDWFGLPNGVRDQLPTDALNFSIAAADVSLAALADNQTSVGDAELQLWRTYKADEQTSFAIGLLAMLPTGDEQKFSGIGRAVGGLALAYQKQRFGGSERWSVGTQISARYLNSDPWQAIAVEPWVTQLAGHVSYRATSRVSLFGRLRLASSPVDLPLRPFDHGALALDLGLNLKLGGAVMYLGFAEDLRVNTEPDVVFRFGWSTN